MSIASRAREKQRLETKAEEAAERAKPTPPKPAFVVTEQMRLARKRLLEKVESVKDQPGPKIVGVSFKKTTGEPYLKFFGRGSIDELHAKYDPELKDFIEITKLAK